jgi:anion-transporting  ArsA/GET3 family ATPase
VSGLIESLAPGDVIICCGSGGVGKTTIAAVIGLELARLGHRAVVVTIDPAKRLADALGVTGELGNEPTRLDVGGDRHGDGDGDGDGDISGELWAAMLDPAATFDDLVRQTAPNPEQAERILVNPFYRNIAGALSGTQEYMAAERLYALHGDPRFDIVIVDTPPSRHALDFLEAPGTLARFLDHPVFKLLMMPARRGLGVFNAMAQPVLRSIGKVVGGDVLADAIAFFQAFDGMESGFRDRAGSVMALLHSDASKYVLVASPKRDTVEEAQYFAGRLHDASLRVNALIVNRSTPVFSVVAAPDGTAATQRKPTRRKVDAALWANLDQLGALAAAERDQLAPLVGDVDGAAVAWVPLLADDVHDLDALERVRALLFSPPTPAG